jgi:hypothetical protein
VLDLIAELDASSDALRGDAATMREQIHTMAMQLHRQVRARARAKSRALAGWVCETACVGTGGGLMMRLRDAAP